MPILFKIFTKNSFFSGSAIWKSPFLQTGANCCLQLQIQANFVHFFYLNEVSGTSKKQNKYKNADFFFKLSTENIFFRPTAL